MKQTVDQIIIENVHEITNGHAFKTWLADEKSINEDDIVILNNSFIFRESSTGSKKSNKYLAFSLSSNREVKDYFVVSGGKSINVEYKLVSVKSREYSKTALKIAIDEELRLLGKLVYILIGSLNSDVDIEVDIASTVINKIVLNPTVKGIQIQDRTIRVHDTHDEAIIWQAIENHFSTDTAFEEKKESLKVQVGDALDALEAKSYSILKIPQKVDKTQITVTEELARMIGSQIEDYKKALEICKGDLSNDKNSFNEILRIAHNFTSDALTFIRLIVSVCDLKPIILWGTIKAHYKLAENFKALPWMRSKRKPSLSNYIGIIGGARNSAFHNLFPFKRSVDIEIPDKSLKQITLRTFSQYTKRKDNQLKFLDKDLVDILVEFTRTNEHKISPDFWSKNLEVMIAARVLFEKTNEFLKILHRTKSTS